MATTGEKLILNEEQKQLAVAYVRASGLFKYRLAQYLKISRPTLDRIFKDDPDFFTDIESANADFCKELIEQVKKKNPLFLLERQFRKEFGRARELEWEDLGQKLL